MIALFPRVVRRMKELCAYWEEKDFRQREEQEMFGRLRNIKEARMAKIERRGRYPVVRSSSTS